MIPPTKNYLKIPYEQYMGDLPFTTATISSVVEHSTVAALYTTTTIELSLVRFKHRGLFLLLVSND